MSLLHIAWRSIQQRGLASLLTIASMALGVMLCVAVLLGHGVLDKSFRSNANLSYNLVVGATKGGKLQLVLNSVFYLSQPVENIRYEYYLEFLNAAALQTELARFAPEEQERIRRKFDPRGVRGENVAGPLAAYCEFAVPICLGDYYDEYRVIGTNSRFFGQLQLGGDEPRPYAFRAGRNLLDHSPEHGYFEAVVGASVARKLNIELGHTFSPAHGVPGGHVHEDTVFHVVGILESTGTPVDRAVFVNMEGFFLVNDHARPLEEVDPEAAEKLKASGQSPPVPSAQATLPPKQREVTAVLVRVSPLGLGLPRVINKGSEAQAALPTLEIFKFLATFITPIQLLLLGMTVLICLVSGITILVSIYNSMSDRRHEIAIMRALGAGRGTVMAIILLESLLLALAGGLLGWVGGHVLIASLSPLIEAQTGVALGLLDFAPPPSLLVERYGDSSIIGYMYPEFLLIPGLMLLSVVVGLLPGLAAYRTDVARSLGK